MIFLLMLAILTAIMIAACTDSIKQTSAERSNPSIELPLSRTDCRTVEHQMRETEICGQPQRIVVLGPYILELLLALDVQPAGFADHETLHKGDYNNPSQEIPYLGSRVTSQPANVGLAYKPSIEATFRLQPDLILGSD